MVQQAESITISIAFFYQCFQREETSWVEFQRRSNPVLLEKHLQATDCHNENNKLPRKQMQQDVVVIFLKTLISSMQIFGRTFALPHTSD